MRGTWRPGGRWRALERQLAQLGCSAGDRLRRAVGMVRGRNGAQAHACKPATGWAGPNHCRIDFPIFKLPPNFEYKIKAILMFKNI
jgi:hypothetical protein